MTEILKNQTPLAPTRGSGVDITRAEFNERGQRPYWKDRANRVYNNVMDGVANLDALSMDRWGNDYAMHQYLHLESEGAWDDLYPYIEPTWFDIRDGIVSGSLVTAAARVRFERNGPGTATGYALRLMLLSYLFGPGKGSRIADGVERDPFEGKRLEAYYDPTAGRWAVRAVVDTPIPVDPPPAPEEPPTKLPPVGDPPPSSPPWRPPFPETPPECVPFSLFEVERADRIRNSIVVKLVPWLKAATEAQYQWLKARYDAGKLICNP